MTYPFLVLALLMPTTSILAQNNLLTNASFEDATLNPWFSQKASGGIVLAKNASDAIHGSASLAVPAHYYYGQGVSFDLLPLFNAGTIQNGVAYEITYQVKTLSTPTTALNLGVITPSNGVGDPVILDQISNASMASKAIPVGQWIKLRGIWKPQFSSAPSTLRLYIGGGNANLLIDDVQMTPMTAVGVGYSIPTTSNPIDFIRIQGNHLEDDQGKTFLMKGFNFYGYPSEGMTPEELLSYKGFDEADFEAIKDMGANTIRLVMSYKIFEDDTSPNVYKEEGFAWVDRVIMWAKAQGLRVFLDMHEPQGGYQSAGSNSALWTTPTLRTRFINLWKAIVTRYQHEPTILGYDLINEPNSTSWNTYAENWVRTLDSLDHNHFYIVEASFSNNYQFRKLQYANGNPLPVVYDVHFYQPWSYSSQGPWSLSVTPQNTEFANFNGCYNHTAPMQGDVLDCDNDTLLYEWGSALNLDFVQDFKSNFPAAFFDAQENFLYPINVGEFGLSYPHFSDPKYKASAYIADIMQAFDTMGVGRQYFAWNAESYFAVYHSWNNFSTTSTFVPELYDALVLAFQKSATPTWIHKAPQISRKPANSRAYNLLGQKIFH